MVRFQQYDMVELTEDFAEAELPRGTRGAIIEVYGDPTMPEAYEIQMSDLDGRALAQFVASPSQLRYSLQRD